MKRIYSCYEEKLDKNARVYLPNCFKEAMGICAEGRVEITFEYGKIIVKKFKKQDILLRPNVGVVRKIEGNSRICIPKEYIHLLSKGGKLPKTLMLKITNKNNLEISVSSY